MTKRDGGDVPPQCINLSYNRNGEDEDDDDDDFGGGNDSDFTKLLHLCSLTKTRQFSYSFSVCVCLVLYGMMYAKIISFLRFSFFCGRSRWIFCCSKWKKKIDFHSVCFVFVLMRGSHPSCIYNYITYASRILMDCVSWRSFDSHFVRSKGTVVTVLY